MIKDWIRVWRGGVCSVIFYFFLILMNFDGKINSESDFNENSFEMTKET